MMMRLVVVGGGLVGLACAAKLVDDGHSVSILDWTPDGERCSHGNAGGIALSEVVPASMPGTIRRVPGWLLDPLGPLYIRPSQILRMAPWLISFTAAARKYREHAAALAQLNSISGAAFERMMGSIGLQGDLHKRGAISVYRSRQAYAADALAWDVRREHAVPFEELNAEQMVELEPALAGKFEVAVFLPTWCHVADPRRIVDKLRLRVQQAGVEYENAKVVGFNLSNGQVREVRCEDGTSRSCDGVIIAAGAYSADLVQLLGERVPLISERGYNATLPAPGVSLTREIIIADANFVLTPLEGGLRIGGAAEFAGLAAPPNYARSDALLKLARKFFPKLDATGSQRWMGNRPATPDSLPVIGKSARSANAFYAFGHGHLGLTQSAATADLIGNLVAGRSHPIDLKPYSIQRFA
jgi:D-amino-acid dehydrogenase